MRMQSRLSEQDDSLMLMVIPGDVGLFEVPQAGDDEDDEDDEDPSVTGVVGKKRPSGVLCRFFCSGDADLLEGCCLLCDEVSKVLSDDEQMGLCPTEVGDCFLFPFFCPLPGFFCRLLRDWFCLFKDGPKELVGQSDK